MARCQINTVKVQMTLAHFLQKLIQYKFGFVYLLLLHYFTVLLFACFCYALFHSVVCTSVDARMLHSRFCIFCWENLLRLFLLHCTIYRVFYLHHL